MARGWESKGVEDQKDAAESARQTTVKPPLTPAEIERQSRRDGLLLSRTNTLNALQGTCDGRYRELLERTLAHIDEELSQIAAESAGEGQTTAAASPTPADPTTKSS